MKLEWPVEIAGTGIGIPKRVLTNEHFALRLDSSVGGFVQRTGIRERRVVGPGESTGSMAFDASRAALADAGVSPEDIDLIICATFTPDHPLPSAACELQAALGCRWVQAFDLAGACSGFAWSLVTGAQYIVTGMVRNVLVVGCESLTRITDVETGPGRRLCVPAATRDAQSSRPAPAPTGPADI